MKQRLAILAVVVAVAALGCWKALAFYNPAVLEVDLDIDGVADSSEFGTATEPGGPGGFVAKDGWKKITLGYSGTALRMRLNWDSLKISIHPDTNGTAAIANPTLWDIENGATMPTNLWVKGMDASSNGPTTAICGPEHICLEAINNGTGYTNPLYDRVGFTVYDVTNIVAIPKGMTEADVQEPVSIGSGAIASDAHQADVKILVQPAVANIPVDVTLLDGPGQDSSTTATLVIGAATATGGGAAITASTASDGSITGILTSSDVLTNCTVHAGQKDRPVLFTWDEYAEDEQWTNSQEYLPFPGVLTNFVVLRHHRIPTNCTPYKPFDGHEIHFFVEQVEYWDTNGTLCVTNNTPDDPQDLSLFAYFDPEQYTTDQDGRVVSFLQVLTNYDISTVTMVAYDYSIWKSNTTVSSGGGGSGGSGGLTALASSTVTTGNNRQNRPRIDNNGTGMKVDLDVGDGAGGGPDGDTDDPEDGAYGYIPGSRGNANILSWSAGTLSKQPMKLVAIAPGMNGVEFEIVSCSKHKGFCDNTIQPGTSSPDYSFGTPVPFATAPVNSSGKAMTDFYCEDFGGSCLVKIKFFRLGLVQHVCYLKIPRDADGDGISDQWEENAVNEWNTQYGESQTVGNGFFAASDDKEKTDPDGSGPLAAHAAVGDSLTVTQEYRGFMFGGPADWGGTVGYKRLSPARKNLLIEVENMVDFSDAATKAEVVSAMAMVKSVFLDSTGTEVDYATDNINAPYANFSSLSAAATYRAAHRDHDAGEFAYLQEYLYLLFCAERPTSGAYGEMAPGWLGANVYCVNNRTRAATLSAFPAGVTFEKVIGHTAVHELGHNVRADHHLPWTNALAITYAPLAQTESVCLTRLGNNLVLDLAPGGASATISLLAAASDTFAELAAQIGALGGYSAIVQGVSGNVYAYTILGNTWIVRPSGGMILRHLDRSVMESSDIQTPYLIQQILAPVFANTGTSYSAEVQLMDFTNKQ